MLNQNLSHISRNFLFLKQCKYHNKNKPTCFCFKQLKPLKIFFVLKSMPLIKEKLNKNTLYGHLNSKPQHMSSYMTFKKKTNLTFSGHIHFFFSTRSINVFSQNHTSCFLIYIKVMCIHHKKTILSACISVKITISQ